MIQYIDKAALVARIKKLKMDIGSIFNEYDEGFWEGRVSAFDDVICALNTIEVKEVDLADEIDNWYNNIAPEEFTNVHYDNIEQCAKHFFEFGLNAKSEN